MLRQNFCKETFEGCPLYRLHMQCDQEIVSSPFSVSDVLIQKPRKSRNTYVW